RSVLVGHHAGISAKGACRSLDAQGGWRNLAANRPSEGDPAIDRGRVRSLQTHGISRRDEIHRIPDQVGRVVRSMQMRLFVAIFISAALFAQSPDYQADGIKALNDNNFPLAVDLLKKAVAADPEDYGAHFHLGLALSLLNKYAEAIPEYRKVLELRPRLYDAELNLGMCLLFSKDAAAA